MIAARGPVLITGGAGFIGCILAAHLARAGHRVRILDDLSRAGVDRNLVWLQRTFGDRIEPRIADVRDARVVRDAMTGAAAVLHFAAQVAVTTSLAAPTSRSTPAARSAVTRSAYRSSIAPVSFRRSVRR